MQQIGSRSIRLQTASSFQTGLPRVPRLLLLSSNMTSTILSRTANHKLVWTFYSWFHAVLSLQINMYLI